MGRGAYCHRAIFLLSTHIDAKEALDLTLHYDCLRKERFLVLRFIFAISFLKWTNLPSPLKTYLSTYLINFVKEMQKKALPFPLFVRQGNTYKEILILQSSRGDQYTSFTYTVDGMVFCATHVESLEKKIFYRNKRRILLLCFLGQGICIMPKFLQILLSLILNLQVGFS